MNVVIGWTIIRMSSHQLAFNEQTLNSV